MALTDKQTRFIRRVQRLGDAILGDIDEAEDLRDMFDSGAYGSIPDGDLAPYDMTQVDLTAFMTACENLVNFRDNEAVIAGDYRTVINKVRELTS